MRVSSVPGLRHALAGQDGGVNTMVICAKRRPPVAVLGWRRGLGRHGGLPNGGA